MMLVKGWKPTKSDMLSWKLYSLLVIKVVWDGLYDSKLWILLIHFRSEYLIQKSFGTIFFSQDILIL